MCGIAGAVALDPTARPDVTRVQRMSDALVHRGPDGGGLWIAPSGRAILAHRRLSVIDLACGAQPMVSDNGTFGLVFNGEIYNYKAVRAELARRGAPFRTNSDTEVLLRAAECDWHESVHTLRGMFAFAAWDDTGERLAARSRSSGEEAPLLRGRAGRAVLRVSRCRRSVTLRRSRMISMYRRSTGTSRSDTSRLRARCTATCVSSRRARASSSTVVRCGSISFGTSRPPTLRSRAASRTQSTTRTRSCRTRSRCACKAMCHWACS
jgi:hypothetical protein